VHSPFIFEYITQCIYSKKSHSNHKGKDIVLKSLTYFQCQSITILPIDLGFEKRVKKIFPSISPESFSAELIYLSDCTEELLEAYIYGNKGTGNNTVVILENIYKNKKSADLWEKVKASEKVTVTVDMFYCAAIFFRKEQVKEDFKIRI
jgi:hypothetical protein